MIVWRAFFRLLGFFIGGVGLSLVIPLLYAVGTGDGGLYGLLVTTLLTGGLGAFLWWGIRREPHEISHREGLLLVTAVWVTAAGLGALPFLFSGAIPNYTDAFFETISGFTTTGATIVTDVEGIPRSLLLWRAMTQWLGGMGIIVLGIAVLPILGVGGMSLYRAEFSGARSEKLKPRVAETALALWRIYVFLSLAEYVALRVAGMNMFDAVCHTFTTMATGGFSTRAKSIEGFHSPAIEYIVTFFMFVAGINFIRHHQVLTERRLGRFWRDVEVRTYLVLLGVSILLVMAALLVSSEMAGEEAFRAASFQVVSIMTTTGFSSADFGQWVPFACFVLLSLMFIGGCTGSTAGGIKVSRLVLLTKVVSRQFKRVVERRGVFSLRMEGRAVSEATVDGLLNLVFLVFLMTFGACLVVTATGADLVTSFSAVVACMFNVGPGLGDVGPASHYAHFPALVKWTLSLCMLAGRLEFFTVLVLLTPAFWRK